MVIMAAVALFIAAKAKKPQSNRNSWDLMSVSDLSARRLDIRALRSELDHGASDDVSGSQQFEIFIDLFETSRVNLARRGERHDPYSDR
jgi:hypothetical protein